MSSTLADLGLKQAYHKPEDDIAQEFYLPCLARSVTYDRAVGFFSSSIYALAWPSLKAFVAAGGRIRLICSPVLSTSDADAMQEGYAARVEADCADQIRAEFQRLLDSPGTVKAAKILAALVALGVVDFRIAWVGPVAGGRPRRLFHDKLGLFRDAAGHAVAFKGSMNETWPGLALDGNLESVDVYCSWSGDQDRDRILAEQDYFDRLWTGEFPGVTTIPLPEVARGNIVSSADTAQWETLVDEVCVELDAATRWSPDPHPSASGGQVSDPGGPSYRPVRVPLPHQVSALEAWLDRDRRGILEHATGSGKTFTALCAIKDALPRREVPLVIVPSDLLLRQWSLELRGAFEHAGLRLLTCGGGHGEWRTDERLRTWTRAPGAGQAPRAVLTTLQTAASVQFRTICSDGTHIFVVADEVHRLGAAQAQQVLELQSGPRLGLSATPTRAGDPSGTAAIFDYFEGIVQPPFTLYDAIQAGTLTPYAYHVHTVDLEQDEQEQWLQLTEEIRVVAGRLQGSTDAPPSLDRRLKHLLIRRARIVKAAGRKVQAAVDVVSASYERGQHWIVYCDSQVQLGQVRDALRAAGCADVLEYHTAMASDSERTLALFSSRGGVVVSIRCLDEGIDIPAVSHALILASSKNPREFIQRRGRVLRRSPGKALAHIHDVLVAPQFDADVPSGTSILEGEIARAIEFGRRALNPACVTDLERLSIDHGLDPTVAAAAGVEDEDEDDPDSNEDTE